MDTQIVSSSSSIFGESSNDHGLLSLSLCFDGAILPTRVLSDATKLIKEKSLNKKKLGQV